MKIAYVRDNKKNEADITREKIVEKSVEYKMLDGQIGYIKLSSFISSSADDFSAALKDLEGKGFDPRKLLAPGAAAIKETVKTKMELFGSIGKAE